MKLTEKKLELLKHALGFPSMYRNHFAACPGDEDDRLWAEMVEDGLAWLFRRPKIFGDLNIYRVTDAGKVEVHAAHFRSLLPSGSTS